MPFRRIGVWLMMLVGVWLYMLAQPAKDKTIARRRAFEDLLWVLVNSKEFLFNH